MLNPRQALPDVKLPLGALEQHTNRPHIAWEDLFTGKIYTSKDGVLRIGELPSGHSLLLFPAQG